jgi:pyrimidine-specific ribonucleoside hydrolase
MTRRYPAALAAVAALLLSIPFSAPPVIGHEEMTPVVIDTDVALDDARALSLLLQDPGVRVLAILTSDGGSSPCDGAARVVRLLADLGHPDIPVGVGPGTGLPAPPWRDVARALDDFGAGDSRDCGSFAPAAEVAADLLENGPYPVTWVTLGPPTNLAEVLRASPEAAPRIRAVYFAGDTPGSLHPGWNTKRDLQAATAVFESGITVYTVSTREDGPWIRLDAAWTETIAVFDSPAADLIARLHRDPKVARLLEAGHAQAWDDTVALALLVPEEFICETVADDPPVFRLKPRDPAALSLVYLAALRSSPALSSRPSVVLDPYPTSPEAFREDVAPHVTTILERHGAEEWKAAVLTNELHRHLGIYSLVGVKMGVRAREILDASLDDLVVESHAGLEPPVSCLTDGLQVSTGASLGRGTIRVAGNDRAAEAVFIDGEARLRLTLRPEIRDRIRADVQESVERYGNLTPEYFDEIRRLSILYWLDLDRREIFLESLTPGAKAPAHERADHP